MQAAAARSMMANTAISLTSKIIALAPALTGQVHQ